MIQFPHSSKRTDIRTIILRLFLTVLGAWSSFAQPSAPSIAPIQTADFVQPASLDVGSEAAFLDDLQRRAFDYFWLEANPNNGLVRDRNRSTSFSSIAATGFGLTALGIGVDRGWITRAQGAERTLTTLKTFWGSPQGTNSSDVIGYKGWFYHFLTMDNGARFKRCELSSVDTALFLAGALYSREFFNQSDSREDEIRRLTTLIYDRVDWQWMTDGSTNLAMGWHPETGFINHRWRGYNEAMILYLLGMGATKPLPSDQWRSWTSSYDWQTHDGQSYITFPSLFGHQFSHCWVDLRGIADNYLRAKGIDYFENSRRATLSQRSYAIANPLKFKGYGTNVWGFTACDGPETNGLRGYSARGIYSPEFDDGTIAPSAICASIAFTPQESVAALRHLYSEYRDKLWSNYGFRDSFNLQANWWASDVLGIDQGATLLMIENYRSQNVWRSFMKGAEIQRGLRAAGFRAVAKTLPAQITEAGKTP